MKFEVILHKGLGKYSQGSARYIIETKPEISKIDNNVGLAIF
jgi:hypothetical protein